MVRLSSSSETALNVWGPTKRLGEFWERRMGVGDYVLYLFFRAWLFYFGGDKAGFVGVRCTGVPWRKC
jgi:hypothetical protein